MKDQDRIGMMSRTLYTLSEIERGYDRVRERVREGTNEVIVG